MVEFLLPRNSRVVKGKHFAAPARARNVKTLKVYRWDPDKDDNPRLDSFEVDLDDCGAMVLDAMIKIKDETDQTVNIGVYCSEGV